MNDTPVKDERHLPLIALGLGLFPYLTVLSLLLWLADRPYRKQVQVLTPSLFIVLVSLVLSLIAGLMIGSTDQRKNRTRKAGKILATIAFTLLFIVFMKFNYPLLFFIVAAPSGLSGLVVGIWYLVKGKSKSGRILAIIAIIISLLPALLFIVGLITNTAQLAKIRLFN